MLTACWQQTGLIPGQRCDEGKMSMMVLYAFGFWTALLPLLTPWWQQALASFRRLLKKSGAL